MNLKVLKGIALLLLIAIIFSCKKDKKAETPVSTGNGYSSNLVEGYIELDKVIDIYGDSLGKANYQTIFRFFDRRVHKDSVEGIFGTNVGKITLNGVMFRNDSVDYVDPTFTSFNYPFKVSNSGSDTGAYRVNFSFNQAFPIYSGYNTLPDTIYRESEMAVNVKDYSHCNSIHVWLGNGEAGFLIKDLSIGDTIVHFNKRQPYPDIFQNFAQMTLVFSQTNVQFINNKNYYIVSTLWVNVWDRPFAEH